MQDRGSFVGLEPTKIFFAEKFIIQLKIAVLCLYIYYIIFFYKNQISYQYLAER